MHNHSNHHNSLNAENLNKAFIWGIALNAAFVIIEFVLGFISGSLGLVSDAGHNLGDTASLILAMLALTLASKAPTSNYTYGLSKGTILVSLVNAVILMVAVVLIVIECIEKFAHPQPVDGNFIIIVAAVGVIINGVTAWLFVKDKDKDLNVKGAYLHMAMDALVSVGVVVSGIVIKYTGWYIIDPIIGLVVAVIIVVSTWELLKDSLRLVLDGVPEGIDVEQIKNAIQEIDGVEDCHHLHIWALSTTQNALTAHIVIKGDSDTESVKKNVKQKLESYNINHATIETESKHCSCSDICSR
ncbi:MAG: cation diffusion facilitator family transporter [Paludibacteraceae bacterium]|nr:cation diffusion facilitator family transporter [Paludibacteraceae bacterium]